MARLAGPGRRGCRRPALPEQVGRPGRLDGLFNALRQLEIRKHLFRDVASTVGERHDQESVFDRVAQTIENLFGRRAA